MVKDKRALQRLLERIQSKPEQIDNSRLRAGSPMYFYCRLCGHLSDTKPESYSDRPKTHCAECRDLKEASGLTDATLLHEAAGMQSKAPE